MFPCFACPKCHASLIQQTDQLECSSCRSQFPLEYGFPNFASRPHYWNQLTPEQMEAFLEMAQQQGYRHAVEKVIGLFVDPYLVGYILNANRADFRTVLPATSDRDVLDLGSGWGGVAAALAPCCRSITTQDTNPYNLRFIRLRAQQEDLNNIRVVRADPLDDARLPYADNSFDVVLFNGALEYVGEASPDGSPRDRQIACLKEARRVLRPGGTLYIGIENRYAYLYFLGTRDHSGLRFTSLLPRPLASLVMRLRTGKAYRTYTYTQRGYRDLVKDAGFDDESVYLAFPTYREPRFILSGDDNNAIVYFWRRHAAYVAHQGRRKLLEFVFNRLPIGLIGSLVRGLSHSYLVVAKAKK